MQAWNTTAQRARADARRTERRRAAITDYAILDTAPEEQYDAVAELAARVAGTPIGLVSFVDERREWVKAAHGRAIAEVDRQRAFGGVVVRGPGEALIVPDATRDQRFAGHPWVAHGPRASFYVALPLRTPGGVAIGTVAVLDPRPRAGGQEVARALRPAARILEEMLEHRREAALSGALTCVVDFDCRFLRVSRGWEQLLGYPADELIGRRFTDFVHPDDLDRTRGEARLRARGEETRAYENRYLTRDGEVRWLSWESEPVPEEGVIYAVAKDITDHKRDELALEESERRFRLLAENATDMIGQWDLEARLVYLSSAARTLLGYAPDELVGRYGYELIHPDDRRLVVSNHEALLRGSERV